MLKIAFWETKPPYNPVSGGIASYVHHRAWVLGQLGFDIWWANHDSVAHWSPEQGNWTGRLTFPLGRWRRRLLGRWPALSPSWGYLAEEQKVDIFEFQAGITSWLPHHRSGPRIVMHCHTAALTRAFLNDDLVTERRMGRFKSWATRNLANADAILACSNEIAMLEAGYFHLHPDRIAILPHVLDRRAATGLQRENEDREKPENTFLIVGNIEYFKGFDLALRGYEIFRQNGGKGNLSIAGCGGLQEERGKTAVASIRPVLERVIKNHGAESVNFLGKLSREQLAEKRARSTAILHCSRFEAYSMVAGEAFLSGTPLILSDRAGLRALVERYGAARLIDPYDPEDIAAAMREMESEENRLGYIKGGSALAAYLTSTELAEKTADFYRNVGA